MPINEIHFEHFEAYLQDRVVWPGQAPSQWAASALPKMVGEDVLAQLPNICLSRDDVRAFCENLEHSDKACFIVIMAWGGRNAVNARKAWNDGRTEQLVHELRGQDHQFSRTEWFDRFCNAAIPGLGAAYFTKLMYFLRPQNERCYIFDQWTARSANLICATTPATRHANLIAYLSKDAKRQIMWLDGRNSGTEYLDYCHLVEDLSERLGNVDPDLVEEAMFSGGGNHRWRSYLRENFHNTMSKA